MSDMGCFQVCEVFKLIFFYFLGFSFVQLCRADFESLYFLSLLYHWQNLFFSEFLLLLLKHRWKPRVNRLTKNLLFVSIEGGLERNVHPHFGKFGFNVLLARVWLLLLLQSSFPYVFHFLIGFLFQPFHTRAVHHCSLLFRLLHFVWSLFFILFEELISLSFLKNILS